MKGELFLKSYLTSLCISKHPKFKRDGALKFNTFLLFTPATVHDLASLFSFLLFRRGLKSVIRQKGESWSSIRLHRDRRELSDFLKFLIFLYLPELESTSGLVLTARYRASDNTLVLSLSPLLSIFFELDFLLSHSFSHIRSFSRQWKFLMEIGCGLNGPIPTVGYLRLAGLPVQLEA